jgi:hypothetical protein
MNRIYDKQEIAHMLDKFMAGETSLNEEQMLAEYFRTNEVGDEWQEYKEMFALFDSGKVDIEPDVEVAQPVNIDGEKVKTLPKDVNTKPKIIFRWMMTGIAASILFIIGLYIFNKGGEPETQDVLVAQVNKPVDIEKEALPASPIIEEQQTASVSQVPSPSKPKKRVRHQDALPANHEEASTETADADIAQEMADIIACLDNFEQQLLSE